MNRKAEVIRACPPPDTNTLLSVADHWLRGRDHVDVVAGRNETPEWLNMDDAILYRTRGAGIWEWTGTDDGEPGVVPACAGDWAWPL